MCKFPKEMIDEVLKGLMPGNWGTAAGPPPKVTSVDGFESELPAG